MKTNKYSHLLASLNAFLVKQLLDIYMRKKYKQIILTEKLTLSELQESLKFNEHVHYNEGATDDCLSISYFCMVFDIHYSFASSSNQIPKFFRSACWYLTSKAKSFAKLRKVLSSNTILSLHPVYISKLNSPEFKLSIQPPSLILYKILHKGNLYELHIILEFLCLKTGKIIRFP